MAPLNIFQTLGFPWDYVVSLFWERYPNPHSKHVLTEDVLERRIVPGRRLYTKRLIMKQGLGKFPGWLRRFLSGARELVIEESVLDMRSRQLDVVTRNVGSLGKYATVTEYCSYTAKSGSADITTISRALTVESKLNPALRSPLTYFLTHRYQSSSKSSLLGYEYVCNARAPTCSTASTSNERTSLTEALKQATRNRSKEAREFAVHNLPRVVMADSRNYGDN
ncbi:PRELI domain-containing protein 1 mitochondrial [Fasciola gigantica]|uniref:PRELI domain-containing protein 1 mitochondrial n=1 Tax=Fasciola gigantica TaxID=46835 RepID=A0A504YUG6_FASGI|nr:PRELI domain-containing protein 1 mitochondrial [Fasciola gigantica]